MTPSAARSGWARVRAVTATVVAVTAALCSTLLAAVLAGQSHGALGTGVPVLVALGAVLNTAAALALVWRHRWPWWVFLLALAGPVLGETDALALLVALVAVLRRPVLRRPVLRRPDLRRPDRRGPDLCGPDRRRAALASGLAWLGVTVSLVWDAHRGNAFSVLLVASGVQDPQATAIRVQPWVPPFVALVAVALVSALGLLLRTRSDLAVAVDRGRRSSAAEEQLRDDAVRAQERTRIARDMHDTLANRLTGISLLAGGLHATTSGRDDGALPERVRERAELILQAAQEAMAELKDVVGVLRGPSGPPRPPGIEAVPGLVEQSRRAGLHVGLALTVHPDPLPEEPSRIAHRVVQEALTNAAKHAGAGPVHVALSGAPGPGIHLQVRNPLGRRGPGGAGGAGLTGLHEQVVGVGGWVHAGAEGQEWVLRGWVPWT